MTRTFGESLRFPMPVSPVQVVVKKRDRLNAFREVWSTLVDPADIFIDRSRAPSPGALIPLLASGDSVSKVDVLILGEGYAAAERSEVREGRPSAGRDPLRDLAVQGAEGRFQASGACAARGRVGHLASVHRRLAARACRVAVHDAFGSERCVLTFDNRAFRDIAAFAPYEFVEILVNGATYGGGGIFNLYATVAADSAWAPCIFVHEFGHHFAGLADEYYVRRRHACPRAIPSSRGRRTPPCCGTRRGSSGGSRHRGHAPADTMEQGGIQAHSRAIQQRRRAIRAANRPEADMDALFKEQQAEEVRMFGAERYAQAVGAFEGAMPRPAATTVLRSTASCSRATPCRSVRCAGER